jgi:hypothetical protein
MSTNEEPSFHCRKLCNCPKCEPIRWALIGWRDHTDRRHGMRRPVVRPRCARALGKSARRASGNERPDQARQPVVLGKPCARVLHWAIRGRALLGTAAQFHTTSKDMPGSRAKLVAIMALPVLDSGKVHCEAIENIYRGDA